MPEDNLLQQNRRSTEEREDMFEDGGLGAAIDFVKPFKNKQDDGKDVDLAEVYEFIEPHRIDPAGDSFSAIGNIEPYGLNIPRTKYAANIPYAALDNMDRIIAERQPGIDKAFNAVAGGLLGGALTALEGFGYLLDIENNVKRLTNAEYAENNPYSSYMKDAKESLYEKMPIYRKNPSKIIDFKDSGFFWEMLRGITESAIGFGVPGMTISKAMSLAMKTIKLGKNVGNALKMVGISDDIAYSIANFTEGTVELLGAARATNFIEGKTMALESYNNKMMEFEQDLFEKNIKSILKSNPNLDHKSLNHQADVITTAQMSGDIGKNASDTIGREVDQFISKNRIFMLTDAFALSGIFKGQRLASNILKKQNFRNLAKTIGKQAPVEYVEEVGQNVLQMQEEYDAMKALGFDVSEDPDTWLERSIKYAVSEKAQLEGMMGLFGGPAQFMTVQAPGYFSGLKAHNEAYEKQQTQIAVNKEFLQKDIEAITLSAYDYEKAIMNGDEQLAESIKERQFDQLAFDNFERGTTKALVDELTAIENGESTIDGIDESAKKGAQIASKRLKELKKDYLKVKGKESSMNETRVRRDLFSTLVTRKALEKNLADIDNSITAAKNSGEYSDLTHNVLQLQSLQKQKKKLNDQIKETEKQRAIHSKQKDSLNKKKEELGIALSTVMVVNEIQNGRSVRQRDVNQSILELTNAVDHIDEQVIAAGENKALVKKLESKRNKITDGIATLEAFSELDEESKETLQKAVTMSQFKNSDHNINENERIAKGALEGVEKQIARLEEESIGLKQEGHKVDETYDVVEDLYDKQASLEAGIKAEKDIWKRLSNKKTRDEFVGEQEQANKEMVEDYLETQKATLGKAERDKQYDEFAKENKGKVFEITVGGQKRNVFIDPENPGVLHDVRNLEGKTKRKYMTSSVFDQLEKAEAIADHAVTPARIESFLKVSNTPEATAGNKPGDDNVDISDVKQDESDSWSKPDILLTGFAKTAGIHHDKDIDIEVERKRLSKGLNREVTTAEAIEVIDSSRRFFAVSEALNVGNGLYSLMSITSANNPFPDENILFYEKDQTAEGSDVKLVLVNAKTKKSIRMAGKLVYTNLAADTLISTFKKEAQARYTLIDEKSGADLWASATTEAEMQQFADEATWLKVVNERKRLAALRKMIVDNPGESVYLAVTSKSVGRSNFTRTGKVNSVVGTIFSETEDLSQVEIEVATSDRILGANNDIIVPKGSVFIMKNGSKYNLHTRILNDQEVGNVLLLLQSFAKDTLAGDENPMNIREKNGKKSTFNVFDTINSMIYFGSRRHGEFKMYFHEGRLVFGNKSISEELFADANIVFNEDGSIDRDNSSEEVHDLINFMKRKIHHVNKKDLGKEVSLIQVKKNDEGMIYLDDVNTANYQEYLLSGANSPLGTKLEGVNNDDMINKSGTPRQGIAQDKFDNIKANPNLSNVYLTFQFPKGTEQSTEEQPVVAPEAYITNMAPMVFESAVLEGSTGVIRFKRTGDAVDSFIVLEYVNEGLHVVEHNMGSKFTVNKDQDLIELISVLDSEAVDDSLNLSISERSYKKEELDHLEESVFVEDNTDTLADAGVTQEEQTETTTDLTDEERAAQFPSSDETPTVFMLEDTKTFDRDGVIDLDEELAWFAERFPSVDVSIAKKIIKDKAYAELTNQGKVLVYEAAVKGVLYHEAWHVVSLMSLSDKEREALYDEYRRNYGNKEMTNKQAEEALADMFREYVISGGSFNFKRKGIKNIFARIYSFLKSLFGDSNIRNEFEKIYNNNMTRTLRQVPNYDTFMSFNKAKVDYLTNKSINQAFFGTLFASGVNFNDLFQLGRKSFNEKYGSQIKNVYHKVLIDINNQFNHNKSVASEEEKANIIAYQIYVNDNWKELVKNHIESIGILNLEVTYDEFKNEEIPYIESMYISHKEKASPLLKVLIGSLPKRRVYRDENGHIAGSKPIKNEIGLYDSVSESHTFNYLHQILAGSQTYEEQIEIIKSKLHLKPEFENLLVRLESLNQPTPDNLSFHKIVLQNKFFQQFAKTKNTYLSMILGRDNAIFFRDDSKVRADTHIKLMWDGKFKILNEDENSPIVIRNGKTVVNKNKKITINGNKISVNTFFKSKLSVLDKMLFMNKLGIQFSHQEEMFYSLDDKAMRKFSSEIDSIITYIMATDDVTNLFLDRENDNANINVAINYMVDIEHLFNTEIKELQHLDQSGKPIYDITLNTYLSMTVNQLNKGEIPAHLEKENGIYQRNSEWLKSSRDGKGMDLVVISGIQEESTFDGDKTSNLSSSDRLALSVNGVLSGYSTFLRAADRGVEYAFKVPGFGLKMSTEQFAEKLYKYLEDEVDIVLFELSNESKSNTKNYNSAKYKLRFFDDIIGKYSFEGVNSFDEFINQHGGKQVVLGRMYDYATTLVNQTDNLLRDRGLVSNTNNGLVEVNGVSQEMITKLIKGQTTTDLTGLGYRTLLETYTFNFIIGNIEQTKIFLGDLAFYKTKDFFKRTTGTAGTKKISRIGDNVNKFMDEHMERMDGKKHTGTINAFIAEEQVVGNMNLRNEYFKYIGSLADPYYGDIKKHLPGIEEADGQGWISLDAYRELLFRHDEWLDEQEALYQWIKNTREDPKGDHGIRPFAIFPPLKPQHFGPQVNNADGYIPVFYKFSLLPIYEELFDDDIKLKDMARQMTEKQIDMILMPSAVKVGAIQTETKLFDDDGNVNDLDKDLVQETSLKYFGIQLDIAPKRKKEAILGTQMRSLMSSNLYNGAIPVDFTGDNWESLSDDEKREKSELFRIDSDFAQTINDLINEDWNYLINELNITKTVEHLGDGVYEDKYVFEDNDFSKIRDVVIREMKDRNMAKSDVVAIDSIFSRDEISVDLTKDTEKIESLLYSLVNNNVITQKLFGDQMVMTSITGYEKKGRKPGVSNENTLKFYRKGEDGKTIPMQVKIPHFFKELFKTHTEITIKNGEIYGADGNKISIDPRMRKLIGFRIPTSGVNSIEFMEVEEFLPDTEGSIIVAPTEIVIKAGSDFDIDKLTVYFPSYFFDKDGNVAYVESDEQYEEYLRGLGREMGKELYRGFDSKFVNIAINGILNKLRSGSTASESLDALKDSITKKIAKLDTTLGADKDLAEMLGNMMYTIENSEIFTGSLGEKFISKREFSRMVKQNTLLTLMEERLSHEASFNDLITPISIQVLEDAAKRINDITGKATKEQTWSESLSPANLLDVADKFWTGVDGIGIVALNITSHSKAQKSGLYIRGSRELYPKTEEKDRLPTDGFLMNFDKYNKIQSHGEDVVSLAGTADANGKQTISDILNQLAQAVIDIAKNPFPADININMDTLGTYIFLMRSGVPISSIVAFMSQPIVLEYYKNKSIMRSRFKKSVGFSFNDRDIITHTLSNYNTDYKSFAEMLTDKTWSQKELESELISPDRDNQVLILRNLINYSKMHSDGLNQIILLTAHDTRYAKNRFEYKVMQSNINKKLVDAYRMIGYTNSKIEDTGFMTSLTKIRKSMGTFYNSLFFTERNEFARQFIEFALERLVMNEFKGGKEREARRLTHGILTFLIQNLKDINGKAIADRASSLLLGTSSVPYRMKKFAEFSGNPIFSELVPVIDSITDTSDPNIQTSYIRMLTRRLDAQTKDEIVEWMELLKQENPNLYNDMIDLSILQSGTGSSFSSFKDAIPPLDYYDRVLEIIKGLNPDANFKDFLEHSSMNYQLFEELFMANNMYNTFFSNFINGDSARVEYNPATRNIMVSQPSDMNVKGVIVKLYNRVVTKGKTALTVREDSGIPYTDQLRIIPMIGNRNFKKYFVSLLQVDQSVAENTEPNQDQQALPPGEESAQADEATKKPTQQQQEQLMSEEESRIRAMAEQTPSNEEVEDVIDNCKLG